MPQNQQQAVPVSYFSRHVVAYHRRGLGSKLRQLFCHLYQTNEIGRLCGAGSLGFRVQNVQAGGTGIIVHMIPAIAHGAVAGLTVQRELARRGCERFAGQPLRNMRHAVVDPCPGRREQVEDAGGDADSGRLKELESFREDALNQAVIEEVKLRSHGAFSVATHVLRSMRLRARATELTASLAYPSAPISAAQARVTGAPPTMTLTWDRNPTLSNASITVFWLRMVVVSKAETPTMSAWTSRALAAKVSPATSTPRSNTRNPFAESKVPTKAFPISWISPLVVPSTTVPATGRVVPSRFNSGSITSRAARIASAEAIMSGKNMLCCANCSPTECMPGT